MIENICLFVPHNREYDSIHTINFVLETKWQEFSFLAIQSVYKMYYVCGGNGFIHTHDGKTPLCEGDIFFTFPNFPFCIESGEDFKYMYISFLGSRGNMLLEKLSITKNNFLFKGCNAVAPVWEYGIGIRSALSDIMSESVVLHTFAFLGKKLLEIKQDANTKQRISLYVKKYIDDNFSNPDFSLESISQHLSYNKKYISYTFKKDTGIGISEYLNTIRIQNACTLMNQGLTSVSDIAHSCGFSDPQYFSKVFKKQSGVTPTQYIERNQPKR